MRLVQPKPEPQSCGDQLRPGDLVAVRLDSRAPWRQAVLMQLRERTVVVCFARGPMWELYRAPQFVRPVKVAWCRACHERGE